jgi:hypothetical protein
MWVDIGRYRDYNTGWTVRGSNVGKSEIRPIFIIQNNHTGSEDHPASYSIGTGVPSRG